MKIQWPQARDCKVCGASAPALGVVDFGKSCLPGPSHPIYGTPVYYYRCDACGFTFSSDFDAWSQRDFETNIYNAEYVEVDPDYVEARPTNIAQLVVENFGDQRAQISVLDFGCGNGKTIEVLRAQGFTDVAGYDAFTPEFRAIPTRQFDLILCFEVMEHLVDPRTYVQMMASLVKPSGLILHATYVHDSIPPDQLLHWWYIAPRNGHVSIFTKKSLALLWDQVGCSVVSQNENLHIARKRTGET